jgi:hypothetical protein
MSASGLLALSVIQKVVSGQAGGLNSRACGEILSRIALKFKMRNRESRRVS